jgi:hypothetical protein
MRFEVIAILATAMLMGCETAPPGPPPPPPLAFGDVVDLTRSGTAPETIASLAAANGLGFSLSTQNVIELHRLGVDDETIDRLLAVEMDRQRAVIEQRYASPPPQISIGLGFGYVYDGGHRHRGHWGHRRRW